MWMAQFQPRNCGVRHAQVEYLRQLGIVDAIIGKMIATRPQLLACDVEGWRTLVKYFQVLGVQKLGIQRILSVHPSVFCMNLEKNIALKVISISQALIFMVFFPQHEYSMINALHQLLF